jgi:hypothetical protein
MRFRLRTLLIVAFMAVLAGAGAWWCYSRLGIPPRIFVNAILKAESIVVYEGLPHQLYERDLLEEELTTKDVHVLHGYPFYREPLEVTAKDAQALAAILSKPSTWRPFSGEKKCGGFHPDYAVEFKTGNNRCLALLCFGCSEGKLFTGDGEWRFNMSLGPRKILEAYQKHRPHNENISP